MDTTIITVLSTLGGGSILLAIVNHFLNRKKSDKELSSIDISNLERTLEFYKKITEDQTNKLSTYMRQTDKLMAELAVLNEAVKELYKLTCTKSDCLSRVTLPSEDYQKLINKDGDRSEVCED